MSSTDDTSGSVDGLAEWLRENQGYDGMGNDPRWEMWADGVERLRAQVEAVRALHAPITEAKSDHITRQMNGHAVCAECESSNYDDPFVIYPCDTIRTLG